MSDTIERMLHDIGATGGEASLTVGSRAYRVFAYPSPGRGGARVRWNLYEVDDGARLRGLTFGMAAGVREAVAEVLRAARRHARTGTVEPPRRRALTFRPSPQD